MLSPSSGVSGVGALNVIAGELVVGGVVADLDDEGWVGEFEPHALAATVNESKPTTRATRVLIDDHSCDWPSSDRPRLKFLITRLCSLIIGGAAGFFRSGVCRRRLPRIRKRRRPLQQRFRRVDH